MQSLKVMLGMCHVSCSFVEILLNPSQVTLVLAFLCDAIIAKEESAMLESIKDKAYGGRRASKLIQGSYCSYRSREELTK
ncbi:hypothetical protein HPP92_003048 [Vanilla planifolia]|uniref:Uncharacterized protein n=1 Tax=Vanilla planifolia TaxID=51239 RepID=A0A835S6F0_VANPL|nr:hypothetical protein HPP92_003048 [Vanilla planifolia]